ALCHARAHSVAGAARPRRSRFQLYKAMARPLAVTAAATSGVAARPGPWSMVRPPSQAPPALPRLKAAMLKADARFGAPPAFSSPRIGGGGTGARAAAPRRATVITAAPLAYPARLKTASTPASGARL